MLKKSDVMHVTGDSETTSQTSEHKYDLVGFFNSEPILRDRKATTMSEVNQDAKVIETPRDSIVRKQIILERSEGNLVIVNKKNVKILLKPCMSSTLDNIKTNIHVDNIITTASDQKDKNLVDTCSRRIDKPYQYANSDKLGENFDNEKLPAVISENSKLGTHSEQVKRKVNVDQEVNSADSDTYAETTVAHDDIDKVVCEQIETRSIEEIIGVRREEYKQSQLLKKAKIEDVSDETLAVEEMGKIKHFKEKTQQEENKIVSIGKIIFENSPKKEEINTEPKKILSKESIDKQRKPKLINRDRVKRAKYVKANKRQVLIRTEVQKYLRQQSLTKKKKRMVDGSSQTEHRCCNSPPKQFSTFNIDDTMELLRHDELLVSLEDPFECFPATPGPLDYNQRNFQSNANGYSEVTFGQCNARPSNNMVEMGYNGNHKSNVNNDIVNSKKQEFYMYLTKCTVEDSGGNIPLHIAVMRNNLAEVKRQCLMLKLRNYSVDFTNCTGLTPLHMAVINNECNVAIVEMLLQNGANPMTKENEGNSSLHLAVSYSNEVTLSLLLKKVKEMGTSVDIFNYEGFTPLMICVLENRFSMAQKCIEMGADPNTKDQKSGRTSLFHAVENNQVDMVTLFLQKGANTKIKNFFGTSTHEATFELDNIDTKIKSLVVGKEVFPNRPRPDRNRRRREQPIPVEEPECKRRLKTVRILKIINNIKVPNRQ